MSDNVFSTILLINNAGAPTALITGNTTFVTCTTQTCTTVINTEPSFQFVANQLIRRKNKGLSPVRPGRDPFRTFRFIPYPRFLPCCATG